MPGDLKKLIKNSLEKAKSNGRLKTVVRDSVKNLAEIGTSFEDMIVGGLAKSFSKLPANVGEIIESYAGNVPESGKWTSEAIISGFNTLSVDIRGKVIKKISEEDDPTAREWAMYMFIRNFNNFSGKTREEILIKFSNDDDVNVKSGVLLVVVAKFFRLSENARELLKKFASDSDPEMRAVTAYALAWKFNEISNYGELLKDLAKDCNESVRKAVAYAIVKNFRNLNRDIQKILVIYAP